MTDDFVILPDILDYQLNNFPKEDCLAGKKIIEGQKQWVKYSTEKVIELADQLSKGLISIGISKGDKLTIISENRPEWMITDQAILQIGAINVPVYPTIRPEDYQYIFHEAEVKVVFVSNNEIYQKVKQVLRECESIKHVFTFDQIKEEAHFSKLYESGARVEDNIIKKMRAQINQEDIATIIYTSGTTGMPKGVMLSHHNIVSNVKACKILMPIDQRHRVLSFLPLNHSFERMLNYLYFSCGSSIYYAESVDTIGENIREVKPHMFTAVPRLIEKVFEKIMQTGHELKGISRKLFFWAVNLGREYEYTGKSPWYKFQLMLANRIVFNKWRQALGGNIKVIVSGSAALSPYLNRIFTAAGLDIMEGYGVTETSPVISVNRVNKDERRFGTVGPAIGGVKLKIADDGEILVKGPNVMKGYYKNEQATKDAFTEDGWYKTNDVGEMVENKYLKIIDRKDAMFKTSVGKFVAPLPIEKKFKESPYIEQIMIVGKDRKFVSALIVPEFNGLKKWCNENNIKFESLKDICNNNQVISLYEGIIYKLNQNFRHSQQVGKFKLIPDAWTVETGELTPTLKLKRNVIHQKFAKEIEEIYSES